VIGKVLASDWPDQNIQACHVWDKGLEWERSVPVWDCAVRLGVLTDLPLHAISISQSEDSPTHAGRWSYLESYEYDDPTSEPVSMANLRKVIHKASSPLRNGPELCIHLTIGRSGGRERSDHRASVSHDCCRVQALLCQPSPPGPHLPERSIHPSNIIA
jgi:hypothetical protein